VRLQSLKNGWEIIEELRQDEQTRLIPIVLCSAAMDELSQREGWLRERGIATLPKPFDIDDLYAAVERQLSG
jgi:CheY-like chemotaxis protein